MRNLREEDGNIIVMTAISLIMLVSFLALAIDVGNIYFTQHHLQTLADAAAMAGALEVSSCSGTKDCGAMTTAATTSFSESGSTTPALLTQCSGTAGTSLTLMLNNGPCALSGDPNSANINYVEAVVSEQVPTFFARVFGVDNVSLSARAEAGAGTSSSSSGSSNGPCLNTNSLTLNSGAGVTDAAGSTCGINDNATGGLSTNSGVNIDVGSFTYAGSSYNKNCGSCTTYTPMPTVSSPNIPDPFKSLTAPSKPATTTTNESTISGNITLQPGTYTNTINFDSGTYTVTLQPGLYYFTGGFNIDSNVTITGSGVTLFFTSGANTNINSAATWDLTAPSAALSDCASCAGMVVWSEGNSLDLDASSSSSFGGAVYMPTGTLTLNGGSNAGAYGMIFANSVMLDSTISLSCSSMPGGTCPGGTTTSSGPTNGTATPALAE